MLTIRPRDGFAVCLATAIEKNVINGPRIICKEGLFCPIDFLSVTVTGEDNKGISATISGNKLSVTISSPVQPCQIPNFQIFVLFVRPTLDHHRLVQHIFMRLLDRIYFALPRVHDEQSRQPVHCLGCSVAVIPMCTGLLRDDKVISFRLAWPDATLTHSISAILPVLVKLMQAMPYVRVGGGGHRKGVPGER